MNVWVLSGYAGFLSLLEDMHVRVTDENKIDCFDDLLFVESVWPW